MIYLLFVFLFAACLAGQNETERRKKWDEHRVNSKQSEESRRTKFDNVKQPAMQEEFHKIKAEHEKAKAELGASTSPTPNTTNSISNSVSPSPTPSSEIPAPPIELAIPTSDDSNDYNADTIYADSADYNADDNSGKFIIFLVSSCCLVFF